MHSATSLDEPVLQLLVELSDGTEALNSLLPTCLLRLSVSEMTDCSKLALESQREMSGTD